MNASRATHNQGNDVKYRYDRDEEPRGGKKLQKGVSEKTEGDRRVDDRDGKGGKEGEIE